MKFKVSVVGTGDVASATALRLAERFAFEVVLYDPAGLQTGARLSDLEVSGAIRGVSLDVSGTSDPARTADSDLIVLIPQPATDADDALQAFSAAVRRVTAYSPEPVLVVANDGVNPLCKVAQGETDLPPQRVIGTGTLPDSARLGVLFARELGIPVERVDALAIGQSGRSALPLVRFATASGIPVLDLIEIDRVHSLLERFRRAASSGGGARSTGRGPHGLVAAIERLVAAVGLGNSDLVPCHTWLGGEYDLNDVFLSVPAVIGPDGVQRVIELDLTVDELVPLRVAASAARDSAAALGVRGLPDRRSFGQPSVS